MDGVIDIWKNTVHVHKTFLVQEFSVENILFFNEVSHFQRIDDEEELYSQAHSIYKQYLETNKAPLEVNLPASIAKDISERIQEIREGRSTKSDIFDECQEAIYKLMESDSFPRFLKSKVCKELATTMELEAKQHMVLTEAGII